ncbi:MAG TPA: S9 family peptidase, partial [Prochlorococcaceae cyanobacterium Fu_MAG_50]|nr:S9 family peptidase [Prochlorococcaceae cyanobacterium Fu_MAG_50]
MNQVWLISMAVGSTKWLRKLALLLSLPISFISALGLRPAQAEQIGLIPREVLFGNPEIIGVSLSPDGERISFLAPHKGVLNLWVQDLIDGAQPRRLTNRTDRPQDPAFWTPDGRYLLTSRDANGDENTVLIRLDPVTAEAEELTPGEGVLAGIVALDRRAPGELVVGLNDRDPRYHDLWVLDLESGKRRLLHQVEDGNQVGAAWLDNAWRVILRKRIAADGGIAYDLRLPESKEWRPFLEFSFEDGLSGSGPGSFERSGTWMYGTLSTEGDLPRMVRWNRETLKTCELNCPYELVHQAESGSMDIGLSDPNTLLPQVLVETDLRSRKLILDQSVAPDLKALEKLAGSRQFSIVDQDLEGDTWLVVFHSDRQSPEYWIWKRSEQEALKLFSVQPSLDQYQLAPMESLDLKARDGLRLPAYLTRSTLADQGPQPLVLLVHGGPQARDYWGLNPLHQLLANRGYHTLSVNYRGSTGFGKAHLLAGQGQWYAEMQDDLVDAVTWAIETGIADPERVVIMGASYGGYAALAGLTRDPELFAAAVDEVGPSNVETLLASIPPYWEPIRKPTERMIGVGKVDLAEISPLNHVDQIKRPLLIAHGANDVRVKLSESETIVQAMKSRGLPVDFLVFPDEGHGLVNPRNAIAFYGVLESFLSRYLGGRAEPLG